MAVLLSVLTSIVIAVWFEMEWHHQLIIIMQYHAIIIIIILLLSFTPRLQAPPQS